MAKKQLIQTFEFKQRYCARNVPCTIRGPNQTIFASVSSQWKLELNNINADWFRKHLGGDAKVPVRVDATNNSKSNQDDAGLDADGKTVDLKLLK
jgi:hypothetical protein